MTASFTPTDLARLAAAAAPTGLFLLDAAGDATYVNPRLCAMLGCSADDLLGAGLASRLLGASGAQVIEQVNIALALGAVGASGESVHRVRRGAPGTEWVRILATRSRDAAGIVGVVEDVTRSRLADASRDRARRLEALGTLAGGLAHDFNNLLVGIVGNATLAELDVPPDGEAASALTDLRAAAERATELTGQLLAFGGRGVAAPQPVDVSAIIEEAIASVDAASRPRIAREPAGRLPRAAIDPVRLRAAVANLLTNALEATVESMGRVVVRAGVTDIDDARRSALTLDCGIGSGTRLFVEVEDGGAGMAPDLLDRAFDPWVTTKLKRRGLGLAAVAGTVRAYKGAIDAVSTPGEGTTIRLLLPIDPSRTVPATPPRGTAAILIVDDESAVRDVTKRLLVRQGHDVLEAASGAEAVDLFAASHARIGCVLLDMTMPGMDGRETLRRMRAVEPAVKVVMTSGHSERELRDQLGDDPGVGFLQKPFDLTALLRVARATLDA